MPKVSVIIPVYNVEKYLKQCLDSVVNQTLKDIEIICIDDKSSDNSLNILHEYKMKDDRFVIIEQNYNQGQGVARNIGINVANGEYIGFVDPDDWIKPEMYEEMYNNAIQLKSDIVFANSIIHQTLDNNEWEYAYRYKPLSLSEATLINFPVNKNIDKKLLYQTLLVSSCHSCNRIFKTDFVKYNKIYFSSKRCFEDCIFILKSFVLADNISYIPKAFYYYRQHQESTLSSCKEICSNLISVFDEIQKFLSLYSLENILADNYKFFCFNNVIWIYKNLNPKKNKRTLIKKVKKYFSKDDYKILKKKLNIYTAKKFYQNIFSIKNSEDKKHKIITILSIKIKIKRSKHA